MPSRRSVPTKSRKKKDMDSKKILIAFIIGSLALIFGIIIISSKGKMSSPFGQTSKPVYPAIATPAPVRISVSQAVVTAKTANTITTKVGTKITVYGMNAKTDFQKAISGTLVGGNIKTIKATAADITVGQQVFIVVNKDTTAAKSILLLQ